MTLAITYADIQEEVARKLGWPRDPSDWSEVQDSDFTLSVNAGMRRFYSGEMPGENKAHNWSFLYPLAEISLTPGYSTGTLEILAGVVTLAVGQWPSWAAEGELWLPDGTKHEVVTRTSQSILTIADTSVVVDPLTTYNLRHIHYNLPSDFGGMYSDSFAYRRDEQWHLPDIKIINESEIRKIDREINGDIYPRFVSLVPVAPASWRARFYPLAESNYVVEYRYKVAPAKLSPSNITPYGGAYYADAIIAAVLDAAMRRIHDSNEMHDEFLSCMRQAIFHDRRNFSIHTMGNGLRRASATSLEDFRRSISGTNINLTLGTG